MARAHAQGIADVDQERLASEAAASDGAGHIPELDGVRGIAILLVLAFHGARHVFSIGWMGVDLFFVLSGFLITLGLLKTAGQPRYFRNFYAKRALRIWPIYYLFIAFIFLAAPALWSARPPKHWAAYVFYVQNLVHPLAAPSEVGHTWSLAIEEQFYLIWPCVVWLAHRPALTKISILTIFGALALRLVLALSPAPAWIGYFSTPCRIDTLAFGALLSLLFTAGPAHRAAMRRWSGKAAIVGTAAGVPLALLLTSEGVSGAHPVKHGIARACLFTFVGLAGSGFVGAAVTGVSKGLSSALRTPWLRYFGKISYGLYIYHLVIFEFVKFRFAALVRDPDSASVLFLRWVIAMGAAVLVASISWYAIERPILRLKALVVGEEHAAGHLVGIPREQP